MGSSPGYKVVNPEVNEAFADSAYEFHRNCAQKPQFSRDLVKRFLTGLVSSEKNIAELWHGDKKIACAILLDQVSNLHQASNIEFLGFSADADWREPFTQLIRYFESLAKNSGKHASLIISHNPTLPFPREIFASLDYRPLYETFELVCRQRQAARVPLPHGYSLEELQSDEFPHWYNLLKESFAQNPETAIGGLEEMRHAFQTARLPTFIVKEAGTMIGFIKITHDEDKNTGEVSTLGVLPPHRRAGLGKYLLHIGLNHLWGLGVESIELSVAAENKKALTLYLDAGFSVVEEYASFLKSL